MTSLMTAVDVEVSTSPGRRTAAVLAETAVGPAVVGAVIGWFAGHVVGLVIGLVVLGVAVPVVVWILAGRPGGAGIDGRAADPEADARLLNLVDGLSISAGLRVPDLRVMETEACNVAVVGRDVNHARIVATSGLLDGLSRIELEGVAAVAVAWLRSGEAQPATVAAAAIGLGVGRAVGGGRDRALDEAAAALTRYPPGLVSAYEKLVVADTAVPAVPRRSAHLWLFDPQPAGAPLPPYRTGLVDRIDALNEL